MSYIIGYNSFIQELTMIRVFVLVLLFVAVVYIYSFLKIRKRKKNDHKPPASMSDLKYKSKLKKKNSLSGENMDYEQYITKYNSGEDYREANANVNESDKINYL